jgi:hypothetical protein
VTSEGALAVFFKLLSFTGWPLFWATGFVGSASFLYWYWETGKFLKNTSKAQQATLDFIENTDRWFSRYFDSAIAKAVVMFVVFLVGLLPVLWIGAVVFCQRKKSRLGIFILFLANLAKIGYSLLGLQAVWH